MVLKNSTLGDYNKTNRENQVDLTCRPTVEDCYSFGRSDVTALAKLLVTAITNESRIEIRV